MEWRQAEEEAQDVARTVEDLGAEVGRRTGEEEEEEWREIGAGGGGPGGGGGKACGLMEVWLGREPQDQPLQDSEEETADRRFGWKIGGLGGVVIEKLDLNGKWRPGRRSRRETAEKLDLDGK